jgi:hypothetical protein
MIGTDFNGFRDSLECVEIMQDSVARSLGGETARQF